MYLRIFVFICSLTICYAQNAIILVDMEGEAGDTLEYEIYVDNSDDFVGFQFDLEIYSGFNMVTQSQSLSERAFDHTIEVVELETNKYRFFSFSPTQSEFYGNSGLLLTFKILLNYNPGTFPILLSNPVLGNDSSQNILNNYNDGQVTVIGPKASFSSDSITFGRVPLESESSQEFVIQNQGNSDLLIYTMSASMEGVTLGNIPSSPIGPGNSESILISFAPESRGLFFGYLTIGTNDLSNELFIIELIGDAYAVNKLIIEDVYGRSGNSVTVNLKITNMDSISGFSTDIILPEVLTYNNGDILLSDRSIDHIISGNQISENIFRLISYSNTNQFFRGDTGEIASIQFYLDGTSGTYPLDISNSIISDSNAVNVISDELSSYLTIIAPEMIINEDQIVFNEVPLNETAKYTLQIANAGLDTLVLDTITFFNDNFFFENQDFPIIISPAVNDSLDIYFHSIDEGNLQTTMRLYSNDPVSPIYDISISAFSYIPNIIKIISDTVKTESPFNLYIALENYENCYGIQFDLIFSENISFLDSVNGIGRLQNHSIQYFYLNDSALRIFAYSDEQEVIDIGSNNILRLPFLSSDSSGIFIFDFENIIIGNADSENIYSNHFSGFVYVRTLEVRSILVDQIENNEHVITQNPIISYLFFDSFFENQTYYHIQVSEDSLWNEFSIIWDSGEVNSSSFSINYSGSPLLDGNTYWLRLKAASATFWSDWKYSNFRLNTPPTAPSLISPINNQISEVPVILSINDSYDTENDNITYNFNVFSDIALSTIVDSIAYYNNSLDPISWEIDAMLPDNNQYFWNAYANDGYELSLSSEIGSFVINASNDAPSQVSLLFPSDNISISDISPEFHWTESIDPDPLDSIHYSVYLWGANSDEAQTNNTDSNSVSFSLNLDDNSSYSWMVTSFDMYDEYSQSDTGYFFTDLIPEPPYNFATISPENEMEGVSSTVEFIWNQTTDPDPMEQINYQLVYSTNWEDSSAYIYSDLIQDTSITMVLENNSQYYWMVLAHDTDEFVTGSDDNTPNSLVVGTLSISSANLPLTFELHQNYPNPFNPTTTIDYDLPDNAHVTLSIYDLMGKKVITLIDEPKTAGSRSIQWNSRDEKGRAVSAGLYLYTIQAGNFNQTNKMVLLN